MRTMAAIALASIFFATTATADEADVTKLMEALTAGDAATRAQAADDLGELGPQGVAAVPALVKALSDEDAAVQWHAALAIGSIGPGAKAAVETLGRTLGDDDAKVRAYSAFALGRIGKASKPALPALVKAITDEDDLVQRAALGALRNIDADPEIVRPLIIKALEDADFKVAMAAVQVLAEEADETTVPRLCEAMKHENACFWACLVLHEIGPAAKAAATPLAGVLAHEEPEVRLQAAMALAAIGPGAEPAVPALVKVLEGDVHEGVKYAAAFALGRIGSKEGCLEALEKGVEDKDQFLRVVSIWAVMQVTPGNEANQKRAVEIFVEGLKSEDAAVRTAAARAVAESDIPLEVRAPILAKALKDADPKVIGQAVGALAAMGAKVAPGVATGLKHKDIRKHALDVLYLMGPEAESAVPRMVEALETADAEFRAEIQFALARIGPGAAAAAPELIASLASKDEMVRSSACFALAKIGLKAESAVPALKKMLTSEDEYARMIAAWTLVQIRPDDDELRKVALPLLIQAVTDAKREIGRIEVANVLGELGGNAADAVPALKKASLEDTSPAVRAAATAALKRIEK